MNRIIKFYIVKELFIIIIFASLTNSVYSSLNPLDWFNPDSANKIIKIDNTEEINANKLVLEAKKKKEKGKIWSAQRIYKDILLKYPKIDAAGDIAYERGIYLYEQNKWIDAFSAFTIIKEFHPDHPKLNEVIELQYNCAEKTMLLERKKTLGIFAPDPLNMEATPLFISFADLYPFNKKTPLALLNASKICIACGELELAIQTLKELINKYPKSNVSPEAHIQIAFNYSEFIQGPEYDLETTREAIRYCEDFLALFPEHEEVGRVKALYERLLNTLAANRVLLADYYYYSRRNNIAALIFYNEAITLAPNSQASTQAKTRIEAIERGVQPTTRGNFIKKLFFVQ